MNQLLPITLDDEKVERVRRSHHAAIQELQRLPLVRAVTIADVTLADGVVTPIAHRFGRRVMAFPSGIRGAVSSGRIVESRDGNYDRSQFLVLTASGWGAVITIDLLVVPQ